MPQCAALGIGRSSSLHDLDTNHARLAAYLDPGLAAVLFASQNDDSNRIFAWQPGFRQVIVRARNASTCGSAPRTCCTRSRTGTTRSARSARRPPGGPVRTVSRDISLLPTHPAA